MIKLEPDLLDMSRLLVAKQIAGAANVEIVAGKLEPGAKTIEIGQHLQPFVGALGDRAIRRRRQISVGPRLRPPDPPAQLIELRQPEAVRTMHHQRICARNIEPALDDRGRQQHVVFAVVEGAHSLFDLGRRHLAVGSYRAHLGHFVAQPFFDVGQVHDARRDVEALPAAIMFAQQRLADYHRVARRDIGPHREPIDRRRLDDRQFAQPRHGHLQRPRDRRRRQRQHMDVGP